MNQLLKTNYDKILVALAVAVLAVSCLWQWQQQPFLRRLRSQSVAPQLAGVLYELANLRLPDATAAVWSKPPSQSHGSGWLYEVFTPPVIYYNTLAKSFTVTPPLYQADAVTPFGLELLAVKQEQYRLQLVGYFGGPGDYLAAFVSPNNPETLLAREGRRFDALGLTLKSFDVKKVLVEHNDPWPVYDVAALAILRDDKGGADVVLDSRARKFTDTPVAVLKLLTGDARPRELHEGDTFADDKSTYRVERIQLDPPEVVVARQTPGLPVPETRVLHPVPKNGAQMAGEAGKSLPAGARHLAGGGLDKSRAGSSAAAQAVGQIPGAQQGATGSQQRETAGQTPAGRKAGTGQPLPDRPATALATNGQ
jgi:hypothetical protein